MFVPFTLQEVDKYFKGNFSTQLNYLIINMNCIDDVY